LTPLFLAFLLDKVDSCGICSALDIDTLQLQCIIQKIFLMLMWLTAAAGSDLMRVALSAVEACQLVAVQAVDSDMAAPVVSQQAVGGSTPLNGWLCCGHVLGKVWAKQQEAGAAAPGFTVLRLEGRV
jgi:hypothetical protein